MQMSIEIRAQGNDALSEIIANEIKRVVESKLDQNTDGATFFIGPEKGKWVRAFGFGRNCAGQDLEKLVRQKAQACGVKLP